MILHMMVHQELYPYPYGNICIFSVVLQSRARLELREKATQGDAEDVVEIMKHRYCSSSTLAKIMEY